MWNILIVLIIAAIIWFFGSSALNFNSNNDSLKSVVPKKENTQSAVKSLTQDTVDQINRARRLQQQEGADGDK
ncbi:MAG: hypothetical protein WCY19_02960 [Candidatus Gastranaerophilaceae bacterium]